MRIFCSSVDRPSAKYLSIGFSETEGLNFAETFVPVWCFGSLTFHFSVGAQLCLVVHQVYLSRHFEMENVVSGFM